MSLDDVILLSDDSKEITLSAEEFINTIARYVENSQVLPTYHFNLILNALLFEYNLNEEKLKRFLSKPQYTIKIFYRNNKVFFNVYRYSHYLQYAVIECPVEFGNLLLKLHSARNKSHNPQSYGRNVFNPLSFLFSYLFERIVSRHPEFPFHYIDDFSYDIKLRIMFAAMEIYDLVVTKYIQELCKKHHHKMCSYFNEFPIKGNWRENHKRWRISNEYKLIDYNFGYVII